VEAVCEQSEGVCSGTASTDPVSLGVAADVSLVDQRDVRIARVARGRKEEG
jgi:hypothetical protein